MENQYLETKMLKELIRRVMTGIDPQCKDDQDALCDILPSFHAYVDTVVKYETKLMLNESVSMGQPYRDMVMQYDQVRHDCHETAIINVNVLNRLADLYDLSPVFTGSSANRHEVAQFCLEMDRFLFENRRMKLS